MNVFQRLKVALTNGLERMQVRREGKRAGKRFAQALDQSPWLQRQFRRSMMSTGGPVLKGKRLARAQKSCCPANLLVQPKGRKYEEGLCNCGQHIHVVQGIPIAREILEDAQIIKKGGAAPPGFYLVGDNVPPFEGHTDTVNEPGLELIGF